MRNFTGTSAPLYTTFYKYHLPCIYQRNMLGLTFDDQIGSAARCARWVGRRAGVLARVVSRHRQQTALRLVVFPPRSHSVTLKQLFPVLHPLNRRRRNTYKHSITKEMFLFSHFVQETILQVKFVTIPSKIRSNKHGIRRVMNPIPLIGMTTIIFLKLFSNKVYTNYTYKTEFPYYVYIFVNKTINV